MAELTDKWFIEQAQSLALHHKEKGPLTRDVFFDLLEGKATRNDLEKAFPERRDAEGRRIGAWTQLVKKARIPAHPSAHGRFGNFLVLLHALVKEWVKNTGGLPSLHDVCDRLKISRSTVHRRCRSKGDIWNAYKEWLMKNEPDSPIIGLVAAECKHEPPTVPTIPQAESVAPRVERKTNRRRPIRNDGAVHDTIAHMMEKIGNVFGFQSLWKPKVNDLRPDKKSFASRDKTLDVAWRAYNIVWVPIEVQIAGSVSDLIGRFQQVHQWSHRLIVVSSPEFQDEIAETLKSYPFVDKVVILAPDEVLAATKNLDDLHKLRTKIFDL